MQAGPGFQQIAPGLQAIMLSALAAGPAGGCVTGHGASGVVRFVDRVPQLLVWQHGRAPSQAGARLQVGDELELGTLGDVMAAGEEAIVAAVVGWLAEVVHKQPDRGLGWTPCSSIQLLGPFTCDGLCDGHTIDNPCQNPHHRLVIGAQPCNWETQREGGVCWQHSPPTQREIDFGSVGALYDRPLDGQPVEGRAE